MFFSLSKQMFAVTPNAQYIFAENNKIPVCAATSTTERSGPRVIKFVLCSADVEFKF